MIIKNKYTYFIFVFIFITRTSRLPCGPYMIINDCSQIKTTSTYTNIPTDFIL